MGAWLLTVRRLISNRRRMCRVFDSKARRPTPVFADLTYSPLGSVKYATIWFPPGTGLVYHHPCETASITVANCGSGLDSIRSRVRTNAICRSQWIRLTPRREANQLCLPVQSTIHSALNALSSGASTAIAQPLLEFLAMRGEPWDTHSRAPFSIAYERSMASKAKRSKCQPCPLGSETKYVLRRCGLPQEHKTPLERRWSAAILEGLTPSSSNNGFAAGESDSAQGDLGCEL